MPKKATSQLDLIPTQVQEEDAPSPEQLANRLQMVKLLIEMKMNLGAVEAMLEFAGLAGPHLQYFSGPIVYHKTLWGAQAPLWLKWAIVEARLDKIIEEVEQGIVGTLATPEEVLAMMQPACLAAPLHSGDNDVLLWCAHYTFSKHRPQEGVDYWEVLGMSHPIEYKSIRYDFEDLAGKVRAAVIKHAIAHGKAAKKSREEPRGFGETSNGKGKKKQKGVTCPQLGAVVETEDLVPMQLGLF